MNVFDLFPGDDKLADNIAKAVKEDSWHGGDNAWSSEHDQWTKESVETIPALTGVSEGTGYYYEELAQAVYANNPELDTSGTADEVVSLGFEIAADELGRKKARNLFAYDEDFASDFVSAYAHLQQGGAEHIKEYGHAHDLVVFEIDSENAYNHVMAKYGNVIDWQGDYMTVPERYWPAVQELVFAAGGDVQEIELDEGWKQNIAALGAAAALGAGGMAAIGGGAPATTGGPEIANPQQIVQQIKTGKIASSNDLVAALSTAKNKNQVWTILQNTAGMQGSSDADAVVKAIALKENTICPVCGCTPCNCTHITEGASVQDIFNAIVYRIERQTPELFTDYGVEVVAEAVREVAYFHEGAEELGSSDVGGMVRDVVRTLKRQELQKSLDEAKKLSTQAKFEKHLAKHGYDVNEKQKYWEKKIKDIDAQIAAWDAEMAARKAKQQGVAETTGDKSFDTMMKGIVKGTKKQAAADRKEQKRQSQERASAAFGNMFGGGNPAEKLSIKKGVAEEYDPSYDPDYRPYEKPEQDPDAWKQQRDLEQPSAPKTVTIKDYDGNVVLTFPSTGGFYGDVRMAKEKGFDTEAGDYTMSWNRNTTESGQGDDSTSPVGGNVQESYWKKLQQDRFVKEHKKALSMLDELNEIFKDK